MTTVRADRNFMDALMKRFDSDSEWVLDWVRENFYPHEVFSVQELEIWAVENGYVKQEAAHRAVAEQPKGETK